jgi:hypothetical protein
MLKDIRGSAKAAFQYIHSAIDTHQTSDMVKDLEKLPLIDLKGCVGSNPESPKPVAKTQTKTDRILQTVTANSPINFSGVSSTEVTDDSWEGWLTKGNASPTQVPVTLGTICNKNTEMLEFLKNSLTANDTGYWRRLMKDVFVGYMTAYKVSGTARNQGAWLVFQSPNKVFPTERS